MLSEIFYSLEEFVWQALTPYGLCGIVNYITIKAMIIVYDFWHDVDVDFGYDK